MIPSLLCGRISLSPRILNWHGISMPNALLLQRHSVKISFAPPHRPHRLPQLLTRVEHAPMHPLLLLPQFFLLFSFEQQPGTVDGPVAEMSLASHSQRRRGGREHVLTEDLDLGE